MDWLLIQAEERHRTEEALVDVNTMRKKGTGAAKAASLDGVQPRTNIKT
jgi:hypothetical protein